MRRFLLLVVASILVLGPVTAVRASLIVEPGFDLLHTIQPTDFLGVPFEGVGLGTFDFGSGPVGVGNADTIVKRIDQASVAANGQTDTIAIEMVALSLRSVAPVDFGLGIDTYFITLDTNNASTGSMDIQFADPSGGLFGSTINVDFDIRKGSLNGAIAQSGVLPLSSLNVPWGRIAPPGAFKIKGVNHLLEPGMTNIHDFWPLTPFTESHPGQGQHTVVTATPEPTTLAIWSVLGGIGLVVGHRRRRRKAA